MLKITGVILCVAGCTGYGLIKISNWKGAIEEMEQWILLLERMKGYIQYRKDVIAEVCCQMDPNMYGLAGVYVTEVGNEAKENRKLSFSKIWREKMGKWSERSNLPASGKQMILNFPNYVGEQNHEQQIKDMEFFLEKIRKEKYVFEKQVEDKRRPLMAVSLIIGMVISILLI